MIRKQKTKGRIAVIISATLILSLLGILFGLAWPPLLIKAGPTLPPRQLPTVPPDKDDKDDDDPAPVGAYIELSVLPSQSGGWAYIQWKGGDGHWHMVDGWAGEISGNQRWWVDEKDFNKGPFRWVVGEQEGAIRGISESFSLPDGANEVVSVTVSVE